MTANDIKTIEAELIKAIGFQYELQLALEPIEAKYNQAKAACGDANRRVMELFEQLAQAKKAIVF